MCVVTKSKKGDLAEILIDEIKGLRNAITAQ